MVMIELNKTGYIICLISLTTKEKVYAYADVMTWKDAYNRGLELLQLKTYQKFDILSITRTLNYIDNEKNL